MIAFPYYRETVLRKEDHPMPYKRTGRDIGRPKTYQSDEERPVTVSVRLPRDLYDRVERYVKMHPGMTLTEFFLDGARLRLDTPADPRDIILSDDNTVMQEVQEMIRAAVQAEIGTVRDVMGPHGSREAPEVAAQPVPAFSHDDNTVIQQEGITHAQQPGRRTLHKLTLRQGKALRAKRARGVPVKALMEEYGLSKATVFRYLAEPD
jgi:hypothetical protein